MSGAMTAQPDILYQVEAKLTEVLGLVQSTGDSFLSHLISIALLEAQEKQGLDKADLIGWLAEHGERTGKT